MESNIKTHLEEILRYYTEGNFYDCLLDAKSEYFILTGQANEDDDDYELRMHLFNDWYIFNYLLKNKGVTAVADYLRRDSIDQDIKTSLNSVNYSLYEYLGENFNGKKVIKDILHKKKYYFNSAFKMPAIYKMDLFTGRVITYNNSSYLMAGLCILPKEAKKKLTKEANNVRKLSNRNEINFLLKVEYLKTKWKRYGHLAANKIFNFN